MILRSCTLRDLELLEEWDTNSDGYGLMWPEDKLKFLTERIDNPDYRMYIAEYQTYPVGWGQIKIEPWEYILSWFIEPKSRVAGLGKDLAATLRFMAGSPCKALININRTASERIAVYIGMSPIGEIDENNQKWWQFG